MTDTVTIRDILDAAEDAIAELYGAGDIQFHAGDAQGIALDSVRALARRAEAAEEQAEEEIERLQAIWQVQSRLIHAMGEKLSDADRMEAFREAEALAGTLEPLRRARPLQIVPYLGRLARAALAGSVASEATKGGA